MLEKIYLVVAIVAGIAAVVRVIWQVFKNKDKKPLTQPPSQLKWGRDVKALETRWAATLVVDIRGFAKVANNHEIILADVTKFINEFFGMTVLSVDRNAGFKNAEINKFLGDGFLIFLNEPGIDRPSLVKAIRVALDLSEAEALHLAAGSILS